MRLAVCISGVNDKGSKIEEQLKAKIPEATFYYHIFFNKTNLYVKIYILVCTHCTIQMALCPHGSTEYL